MCKQLMFSRSGFFAGALVAIGLCLTGCEPGKSVDEVPAGPAAATQTNSSITSAKPRAEFEKLIGKWLRPDGGYVLELKSVDAQGTFAAGYFNPNPINVSKAMALQEGSETKVFVELRDVNYPGCTYSLKYDPATDQLFGQYYQAAAQQTYDITFERLKDK